MLKTNLKTNFSKAFTSELIGAIPEEANAVSSWLNSRHGKAVVGHTKAEMGEAYCRMALTASALEQVGKLSMAEGILNQAAPWGQARYKSIVDSFTAKTVEQINNF